MCCRDAWDMAAEICLSQLPQLVEDPNAEFEVRYPYCFSYILILFMNSDGVFLCQKN